MIPRQPDKMDGGKKKGQEERTREHGELNGREQESRTREWDKLDGEQESDTRKDGKKRQGQARRTRTG